MEKCPKCGKSITWQLGVDYYCIEGEQDSIKIVKSDNGDLILHFCTCGRLLAVNMETEEGASVFIDSENVESAEDMVHEMWEQAPSLKKEGLENWAGYFVSYDRFIKKISEAWGATPFYECDPFELIGLLTSERDGFEKSHVDARVVLSRALRAICLTRDYVGEERLPPIAGWEWFEAGKMISDILPGDEWSEQFKLRIKS